MSVLPRNLNRWFMLLLGCLIPATALADCAFNSVSGSGFDGYGNGAFYVLPSGGSGSLSISFTASSGCTWSVSSPDSWVTFPGPISGSNSNSSVGISVNVAANTSSSEIAGSISVNVNGSNVANLAVYENSNSCGGSLSPPSANVSAQAGSGSFTLTAGAYCWWGDDQSNSPWFTVTSAVYNETGTVTTFSYSVTANTGDQRTATVTFLVPVSATFTITQAAGVPPLTITSPTSLSPGTAGTAYGPVTFTASGGTGGYTWSAAGLPNGLSISPASGALSGTPGANSKGSYTPQFTVQDSSSDTASLDLALTINNPTPILTSLIPASATPGGPAFTLTVNGSGFVSGASVQWNGSGLSTTFVSASQLTASVPATLIAAPWDCHDHRIVRRNNIGKRELRHRSGLLFGCSQRIHLQLRRR